MTRSKFLFTATAVLTLVSSMTPVLAEDSAEQETWSVAKPPGEWATVVIDTDETTWSNVDVSPDGTTLVFDVLGDIFTVPIAGGEAQALTDGIEWSYQPRYHPDGSEIVFVSDRGGADNLWVMNADGSEPRAVTDESDHLVHNPSWSPDGRYLVAKKSFMSTRSIAAGEIWLFHPGHEGGGLQVTERPHGDRDQKNQADPSFSSDGQFVYFSQDTTSGRVWQYGKDSTGQIFVIQRLELETGEIEAFVTGPGGAVRPTPSPDGKTLAFVRRIYDLRSAIYLKDLESGREWAIYRDFERDLQETSGTEGNAPAFAWTPDSESIVFWSGGGLHRIDVESREVTDIPVHVRKQMKVRETLRRPVEVAPEAFRVKMARWPVVSPDGDLVVFEALGVLWRKELPDGEPRRVTSQDDHFESHPSFSADGGQIVYTTWDDENQGSVRVVASSGGESRRLTEERGNFVEPAFSPDGETVVFRQVGGGYLLSPLWSLKTGIATVASSGGETSFVNKGGSNPRFSPDGERIFMVSAGDGSGLVLESVNLSGGDPRIHVAGAGMTDLVLSPDSRWLAFVENYDVHVAPFVATGRTVSVAKGSTSIPVSRLSGRAGDFLSWEGNETVTWSRGSTLYRRGLSQTFAFVEGSPEELPEPLESGVDIGFEARADLPSGGVIALVGARLVTMRGGAHPACCGCGLRHSRPRTGRGLLLRGEIPCQRGPVGGPGDPRARPRRPGLHGEGVGLQDGTAWPGPRAPRLWRRGA